MTLHLLKTELVDYTINGEKVEWDTTPIALIAVDSHKRAVYLTEDGKAYLPLKDNGAWEHKLGKELVVEGKNIILDLTSIMELPISDTEEEVKDERMFWEEHECRHCGAPMGIYSISKESYAKALSTRKCREFQNHTDSEARSIIGNARVDGVVIIFRVCSSCRSYEC